MVTLGNSQSAGFDWSGEANGIKEAQAKGLTPRKISTVHHGPEW